MNRIGNWYRWWRHGYKVTGVTHLTIDGVDIQITSFKDHNLDKVMPLGPRVLDVDPFEADMNVCPNLHTPGPIMWLAHSASAKLRVQARVAI